MFNFSVQFLTETALFLIFAFPLCVMDIRKFRISLWFTLAGTAVFLIYRLFFPSLDFPHRLEAVISSVLSSLLVLVATRVFSAGGLGKGDIIFGIFTSLYCPFWKNLAGLLFAALIGLLIFLSLAVVDKIRKNSKILHPVFAFPFVPFITAGAILARIFFE